MVSSPGSGRRRRTDALIRFLLAALLVAESLARAVRLAALLPALAGYDATAVLLILAGGLVAALQFSSGWMLAARRPPAAVLARWAFLGAAIVITLTVGFGLAPTAVYPWWRWQVTGGYWAYAIVAVICTRHI